jgi:hypothetical protein
MARPFNDGQVFRHVFHVVLQALLYLLLTIRIHAATGGLVAWGGSTYYAPQGMTGLVSAAVHRSVGYAVRPDGTVLNWQSGPVAGISNVSSIVAGYQHTIVLKSNQTITTWGHWEGVNIPTGVSNIIAVAAGDRCSVAVNASGNVTAWGYNWFGQCDVPAGLSNVVAVSSGPYHTVALKQDGTLAAWGWNHSETTVIPPGLSNVVGIAAGEHFSVAVKADGRVVAWGYNDLGRTSVPVGLSNVVAVGAGDRHALALKSDGSVVAWGYTNSGQTLVPSGLSNAFHIAAGANGSVALTNDGSPSIAWQARGRRVYTGATTVLEVGAVSPFSPSYQWSFNGIEILNATNSSLMLTNLQLADAGEYTVVITNVVGAITSVPTHVEVAVSAPILRKAPMDTTSVLNATKSLSVSVDGSQPLVYQWHFNDLPLVQETNSILVISNVQEIHAGSYHAVVTNSLGSVTTTNATLKVLPFRFATNPMRNTNGFLLKVENIPEKIYSVDIYASTNLSDWQRILAIPSFFLWSSSWFEFTDQAATNLPQRFYRLECPPAP